VKVWGPGVKGSSSSKIEKDLPIPRFFMNSNSKYCNVIQIFYELKVEAQITGFHRNIEIVFPITIGSIPLRYYDQPTPSTPGDELTPLADYYPCTPDSREKPKIFFLILLEFIYLFLNLIAPPSYEEANNQENNPFDASFNLLQQQVP
jgi:hypothetical protein